jgi:hypothetical protein
MDVSFVFFDQHALHRATCLLENNMGAGQYVVEDECAQGIAVATRSPNAGARVPSCPRIVTQVHCCELARVLVRDPPQYTVPSRPVRSARNGGLAASRAARVAAWALGGGERGDHSLERHDVAGDHGG